MFEPVMFEQVTPLDPRAPWIAAVVCVGPGDDDDDDDPNTGGSGGNIDPDDDEWYEDEDDDDDDEEPLQVMQVRASVFGSAESVGKIYITPGSGL